MGLYQLSGFPPNGDQRVPDGRRDRRCCDPSCEPPDPAPGSAATRVQRPRPSPTPHPDHQGREARPSATRSDVPLWVGEADVPAMETGTIGSEQPNHWLDNIIDRVWSGPPRKGRTARCMRGDEVAGFRSPRRPRPLGRSRGLLARVGTRALVLGDVLTGITGPARAAAHLHPGPGPQTASPRAKARRAGTGARVLRTRAAAAKHEEVRRLREFAARLILSSDN